MRTLALALAIAASGLTGCSTVSPVNLEDVRAGNLGATQDTAIKVSSVKQEYEIVASLGLEMESQSLAFSGRKAFDVIKAKDPETGNIQTLWFDVSSFFGRMF